MIVPIEEKEKWLNRKMFEFDEDETECLYDVLSSLVEIIKDNEKYNYQNIAHKGVLDSAMGCIPELLVRIDEYRNSDYENPNFSEESEHYKNLIGW